MDANEIDPQELADRYEQNPDEVMPEIIDIVKKFSIQDEPLQNTIATEVIEECSQRNPTHFRNNFYNHIKSEEEEWITDFF